ncbi:MAG: TetR/AcrR family transcriptional regulator [Chloroflexota bacterium]
MRYSKEHKQQTHEKIVQVASTKFRENGFDGVSIGALMSELALTHGGFYRHFSNKEDLYKQAFEFSIEEVQTNIQEQSGADGALTLGGVIAAYLNIDHSNGVGDGCPVAAQSAEISRLSANIKASFDDSLKGYMDAFMPLIEGQTEKEKQKNLLVLFSGMAGALMISRAISDQDLRMSLLEAARDFYTNHFAR